MSITITHDVFCDICESNWEFGCCHGNSSKARLNVSKTGWQRIAGQDVCPRCVVKALQIQSLSKLVKETNKLKGVKDVNE